LVSANSRRIGGLGHVALDRDCLAAVRFDVSDNAVRALLTASIVHYYCGASRAQAFRNCRAYTLRCTGHDRYFSQRRASGGI
jgi:hypothetical protein